MVNDKIILLTMKCSHFDEMPPANVTVSITKTKKTILLTLKCSQLDEMPTANVTVSKVSEVSDKPRA